MEASMRRKVRAALRRGKARIADPRDWIQGASMLDAEGRDADVYERDAEERPGPPVAFCATGALAVDRARRATGALAGATLDRAALALDPTLAAVHGSAAAAYNDARTHVEVMVLFDVALALVGAPPPAHDCDFCRQRRTPRTA